ncbi:MAG: DUF2239 family protein [Steroidobacteraceae bacterium]|nr:DUF2239 family protein [Steroidobacteraceae bacterium]
MTEQLLPDAYLAFMDDKCIASGSLLEVALAVRRTLDAGATASIVVLHARTAHVVDLDLRGTADDIASRLTAAASAVVPGDSTQHPARAPGPGRPRLGVISREVSLLPRHWNWLATQRGGASAALRRLVDEARQKNGTRDSHRAAQEAVDRYMRVLAGDRSHYEDALRAFYAGRDEDLFRLAAAWPADIRNHLETLVRHCRELAQ